MNELTLETLRDKYEQYRIGKQNLLNEQQRLTYQLQQIVANINANEGAMQALELLIDEMTNENGTGIMPVPVEEFLEEIVIESEQNEAG